MQYPEVIQAVCAIVQTLVTVGGFLFVISQIRMLGRQLRGDAHDKLFSHYARVTERMHEKGLDEYFCATNAPTPEADVEREVNWITEQFVDFFEHLAVQLENLPPQSVDCWKAAVRSKYRKSVAIREYYKNNNTVYAAALKELVASFKE